MVAISNPKLWLQDQPLSEPVGILAFEVAAAMTRLISIRHSLTPTRFFHLRSECMRSQGVAYLNSTDQYFLLRLACAELIDDLDRTAASISRFCTRCRRPPRFDRVYKDLKAGEADPKWATKCIDKTNKRMERFVSSTSRLCEEMEVLAELEAAERKLEQRWSRYSGPIPKPAPISPLTPDSYAVEIKAQRQKVRRLKEESLWDQSFDRVVSLLAHATCAIFARICTVFSDFVPGLPSPARSTKSNRRVISWLPGKHSSGPLVRRPAADMAIRPNSNSNSCPIIGTYPAGAPTELGKLLKPAPRTVGGAGLAERYASVIVLAERLLVMREQGEERREEEAAREELYEMLPEKLRNGVKGKLRAWWRKDAGAYDGELAEGWREAVGRIIQWLAPVARDTVQWQAERNMDRRQRFDPSPRVMLLQTLHFADREKTEAAITEVLVGLSLVGWYEERRRASSRF